VSVKNKRAAPHSWKKVSADDGVGEFRDEFHRIATLFETIQSKLSADESVAHGERDCCTADRMYCTM